MNYSPIPKPWLSSSSIPHQQSSAFQRNSNRCSRVSTVFANYKKQFLSRSQYEPTANTPTAFQFVLIKKCSNFPCTFSLQKSLLLSFHDKFNYHFLHFVRGSLVRGLWKRVTKNYGCLISEHSPLLRTLNVSSSKSHNLHCFLRIDVQRISHFFKLIIETERIKIITCLI